MSDAHIVRVEFYRRGGCLIAVCKSTAVPRQGECVNIEKKQWRVACVSWALDVGHPKGKVLRANVELEEITDA